MQLCLPAGAWSECGGCGPPCDAGPPPDADRYDPWSCGAPIDAGVDAGAASCTPGVLSWSTVAASDPSVQLHSLWGSSAEDVWAVGERGTSSPTSAVMLHRDEGGWSEVETGARSALRAVWGTSPADVWAVGGRELLHFDGVSWVVRPFFLGNHLDAIWGSCGGGVWVGSTSSDSLEHDDGIHWTTVPASPPSLEPGATVSSLFGFGSDDLWAVGVSTPPLVRPSGGLGFSTGWRVRHWNGASFVDLDLGPSETNMFGPRPLVWGAAPDDVWIAGDSMHSGPRFMWIFTPLLHHWDGAGWTAVALPGPTDWDRAIVALWGTGANDVWARDTAGQLFHFDGSTWTASVDPAAHTFGECGWSADSCHVFTGGAGGTIVEGVAR